MTETNRWQNNDKHGKHPKLQTTNKTHPKFQTEITNKMHAPRSVRLLLVPHRARQLVRDDRLGAAGTAQARTCKVSLHYHEPICSVIAWNFKAVYKCTCAQHTAGNAEETEARGQENEGGGSESWLYSRDAVEGI
jgi:hypothetical protein